MVRIGVLNVLGVLGNALVFTFIALPCHRIVLLEEQQERWLEFFRWNHRETRFFIWGFLICFVVILVLLLPLMMGTSYSFLTSFVMNFLRAMDYFFLEWLLPRAWVSTIMIFGMYFIPYFIALYVLSRVSLILPATAIDEKPTLAWIWKLSTGNGWRLTFLTTIPMIVCLLVSSSLNMVDFMPPSLFWIPGIIGIGWFVFWGMLEAVLLSEAYKELRSQQQVPSLVLNID